MARQECFKKGLAQPVRRAEGRLEDGATDENTATWYYQGKEFRVEKQKWDEMLAKYKAQTDAEHDEVVGLGGLHILGTERHESRRIDNQLRGRAGRQGDPGSSRFYLSLEDDLMRIFAKEWVSNLLQRLGMEEGVPIESRLISRRIEAAQKAVEGAELRISQAPARVRRRDEQAARGGLRPAPPVAGGRRSEGSDP